MIKPLLMGGILGGLVVFTWGAISWMVLPWHDSTMKQFSNQDVVAVTLDAYAPETGVYFLAPGLDEQGQPINGVEQGRVVFAAIQDPMPSMNPAMLKGLVTQILAALLVTWLVLKGAYPSFGARVSVVLVFAAAASLVGVVPNWIWWGFATDYSLVMIADMVIGWGLAGVVIAWATGAGKA